LTGEEFTERYFDQMEILLGMRSEAPTPAPQPAAPSPRLQAPVASGPMVSAPPTRDSQSWSSGRPLGETRTRLTAEEMDLAERLGLEPAEYLRQKEKLMRLKQAGAIQ